jgi:hypothetical protein
MDYKDFLEAKKIVYEGHGGKEVDPSLFILP